MRGLLIICLLLFFAKPLFAYPQYIGFGYTSCVACHFNPMGNGPLTDYGRALAATEIAGEGTFADPEKLTERSGFFAGYVNLPAWFRPALAYRGLSLASNLQSSPSHRFIHMQMEASISLPFTDRFLASATIGYVPPRQGASAAATDDRVISREHYVGARITDNLGVYVGMMDTAFGLRLPDHQSYVRADNQLNINDQTHGALLHYGADKWEGAFHLFTGNLFQKADLRQKGFSVLTEFDTAERVRLGGSVLFSKSDFRSRMLFALHGRIGFQKGSAILLQAGLNRQAFTTPELVSLGHSLLLQSSARIYPGLYWLMTVESSSSDFTRPGGRMLRFGPSFQYIPFQRLELRTDFQILRLMGLDESPSDILNLLTQVHVWL